MTDAWFFVTCCESLVEVTVQNFRLFFLTDLKRFSRYCNKLGQFNKQTLGEHFRSVLQSNQEIMSWLRKYLNDSEVLIVFWALPQLLKADNTYQLSHLSCRWSVFRSLFEKCIQEYYFYKELCVLKEKVKNKMKLNSKYLFDLATLEQNATWRIQYFFWFCLNKTVFKFSNFKIGT